MDADFARRDLNMGNGKCNVARQQKVKAAG
jgi:hypothetical protein